MSTIVMFCDRLAGQPGEHDCELAPGHAEACRCECESCQALVTPYGRPAWATLVLS